MVAGSNPAVRLNSCSAYSSVVERSIAVHLFKPKFFVNIINSVVEFMLTSKPTLHHTKNSIRVASQNGDCIVGRTIAKAY